jgi:hypothetical protein
MTQVQDSSSDPDGLAKVELMKINAERKKKGLPFITEAEMNEKAQKAVSNQLGQPPEEITVTLEGSSGLQAAKKKSEETIARDEIKRKFEGFNQLQVQNIFGTFQSERIEFIARESEKSAFEVYFFKRKELEPPEMGIEPTGDYYDNLVKKVVYFHMLPSHIYNQIKDIRNQLNDLGRVEALTRGQFGEDGRLQPAKLDRNDFSVTQLSDEQFARLHQLIGEKTMQQYKLAAKWFFGIPEKYIEDTPDSDLIIEDNSFRTAIDAAMYKVEWAIRSSKKSANLYG